MNYSNKLPDKTTHINISVFGGLNRRIKASAGEFSDLENIGHGEYPCLSSTKNHKEVYSPGGEIIKYLTPKGLKGTETGFTGVIKESEDKYNVFVNGTNQFSTSEFRDILDFNGTIVTAPEFTGFNYMKKGTDQKMSRYSKQTSITIKNEVSDDNDPQYTIITAKDILYSAITNYIKVGSVLALSGFTGRYENNNTIYPENSTDYSNLVSPVTITVAKLEKGTSDTAKIHCVVRNAKGKLIKLNAGVDDGSTSSEIADIYISQYVPQTECFCVHDNRVWCANTSGEMIQTSALGDPFEFYELGTLSTDSWYVEVGTPGKFTGIISWHSRVLAFKEECIHVIYGTEPANYSLEKSYANGCISKESLASVGNHIIWLSHDGFYEYAGGEPRRISEKLNTKYVSCVAFGDNRRYYARCEKESGEFETVIFDTETRLWSKMTDFGMRGGDFARGTTYIYNGEKVFLLNQGEHGEFFAESVEMDFGSFKDKSVIYLQIRCKMGEGAFLNVYTAVDGGEWIPHKGIDKSGKHKMPIRFNSGDTFRMRLEGKGEVHVMDMELTVNSDGV